MRAAKKNVVTRAIKSPACVVLFSAGWLTAAAWLAMSSQRNAFYLPNHAIPIRLLDHRDLFFLLRYHRGWERRVIQRRRGLLPLSEDPIQEHLDLFALGRVREPGRNQQIGIGGNGIRVLAGSVSDGDPEILGYVLDCRRRGFGHGGDIGLDEVAGGVFHGTIPDLLVDRID